MQFFVLSQLPLVLLNLLVYRSRAWIPDPYSSLQRDGKDVIAEQGSGIGETLTADVILPVCLENEYLSSNGTHLICKTLPECSCDCTTTSTCDSSGSGFPISPRPPDGCPVFQPPTRGAHVCLRVEEAIYCNVYCDHRFEFSDIPLNPYWCGSPTGLEWRKFPRGSKRVNDLPRCTGNRHRLYLVNSVEYYLPAPCYGLTDYTILAVMKDFLDSLIERGCRDCPQRNMFLLCPEVNQQTIFYDDVMESYTTNNN